MDPDLQLVDTVRAALMVTMKIALPILASGVVVGLFISIVQSVTSIQEQTLTFVPKILVMLMVAVLLIPWIVQRLLEFATYMFTHW
ncbi:MAG: flagellar biosynthetic protein FliQ [Phycisphaeraceae bacterium]|nr:flagellar biosynthetic protein FliQ [Phycisphaeraceae bacterium]MBX3406327.1 flagellar biosynthetic protein FliQ [Phycisphaeraceae bacterium]